SVFRVQKTGAFGELAVDKMPVTGLMKVHSAGRLITDSAAGATAMATGHKTLNGMVGVLPDSTPVPTILEICRDQGLATGLVATSSITHATPACFASHIISRYKQEEIAVQLLQNKVDVLLGGGRKYFLPEIMENGSRSDNMNLVSEAQLAGYDYVESSLDLNNSEQRKILGLFANEGFTNSDDEPALAEMTRKAIEVLSQNTQGFFLVVEGSQIDWAGHNNDLEWLEREMLAFDEAVTVANKFAIENDETLIVVTADHETGGLSIVDGKVSGENLRVSWATDGHTSQMVPVYASGKGANRFTGTLDNTEIPIIMTDLLGFGELLRVEKIQKISY
ncbi:MAG: alkaline phosphatase, partial [Calditrichaeota bacterium]